MRPRKLTTLARILIVVVMVALSGAAISCQSQSPTGSLSNASETKPPAPTPTPASPNQAPDFSLPTMEGQQITLSQLEGTPVVLLFWASWCPYCRVQLRYLERAAREGTGGKVIFLAVNVGESISTVRTFFGDYQPAMIVALDESQRIFRDYNSRYGNPGYMPVTFFIDSERVIREVRIGAFADDAELRESLGALS